MGNLAPVLGTLTQTLGAIQTISSVVDTVTDREGDLMKAQQNQAMRNLQAQQNQSLSEAQNRAKIDRERLQLEQEQSEKRRQDALRRTVARQNARRGAGGVSAGGSNEAVLLGLVNDNQDDQGYADALDQIRYNTIDQNVSTLQSRNILERSQLAERQRLERAMRG